jgi:hypothetical protein
MLDTLHLGSEVALLLQHPVTPKVTMSLTRCHVEASGATWASSAAACLTLEAELAQLRTHDRVS